MNKSMKHPPVPSKFANGVNWKEHTGLTGTEIAILLREAAKYVDTQKTFDAPTGTSYAVTFFGERYRPCRFEAVRKAIVHLQFGPNGLDKDMHAWVDRHGHNSLSVTETAAQLRMWAYQVRHGGKTAAEAKRLQMSRRPKKKPFSELYPNSSITEQQASNWGELIAALKNSPNGVEFDYSHWIVVDSRFDNLDKLPEGFCGTTACVAGHLALTDCAKKAGYGISFRGYKPGWAFAGFKKSGFNVQSEAMASELLGLSVKAACNLFFGGNVCSFSDDEETVIAKGCGLSGSREQAIDRCECVLKALLNGKLKV